jgi:ABC-type dipeptide/oligopeptide/nickel transport system permease subunit
MAEKGKSLWQDAFERIKRDKLAVIALVVVVLYSIIAILSGLGLVAADWGQEVGGQYMSPNSANWLGTDIFGRDVFRKVVHGTQIAMSIGFVTTFIAVFIGVILGALAGYFGGYVDEFIVWFYTTMSSIPGIILLMSLVLVLGKGLLAVYIALGITSWVGLCRLVRGEVMKHKHREYVQAAGAIGCGHFRKLFIHILPNVFHIVIIQSSLLFQTAIKSEVILSYLGIGVQNQPSWGTMINDAKTELTRAEPVWWQLAGASVAMFFLVLALNILGDAVRDALDPKLKGKD